MVPFLYCCCPSRKTYPGISMMQPGQDWCSDDCAGSLDATSYRRILPQSQVRTHLIVKSEYEVSTRSSRYAPAHGSLLRGNQSKTALMPLTELAVDEGPHNRDGL